MEILRTFYVLPIYISHELKRKKKGSLYIQTFERETGAVAKLLVLESLSLYPQSVNHLFLLGKLKLRAKGTENNVNISMKT